MTVIDTGHTRRRRTAPVSSRCSVPFSRSEGVVRPRPDQRRASAVGVLVSSLSLGAIYARCALSLPATASAYATLEGPPVSPPPPASPTAASTNWFPRPNKNGNEAGASSRSSSRKLRVSSLWARLGRWERGAVRRDRSDGGKPVGRDKWFCRDEEDGRTGWKTRSLLPRQRSPGRTQERLHQDSISFVPDLSHAMVEDPDHCAEAAEGCLSCISPVPTRSSRRLGGSPKSNIPWSTAEMPRARSVARRTSAPCISRTPGTLLPARRSVLPAQQGEAWGFYENSEGVLREAGVLPDDSREPRSARCRPPPGMVANPPATRSRPMVRGRSSSAPTRRL